MKRPLVVALPVAVLAMLAGCGYAGPGDGWDPGVQVGEEVTVDYEAGSGAVWSIGVGPRLGDISECVDDTAVASSVQSADLPSSHLGIELTADATRTDADRVVACLGDALTAGEIVVVAPAGVEVG